MAIYFVACNGSVTILIFKPQYKYEIWRYFTYHLIHFSLTHLALNMFLQVNLSFEAMCFSSFASFSIFSNSSVSIEWINGYFILYYRLSSLFRWRVSRAIFEFCSFIFLVLCLAHLDRYVLIQQKQ